MLDSEVLIVGAGVTGIYQLYRARAGRLLGHPGRGRPAAWAAPGTGTATPAPASTPRATPTATCSRRELFDEWEWTEHFAGPARDRALPQPRGRPLRPAPPHPVRDGGHLGWLRRVVGHLAGDAGRRLDHPDPVPDRGHRRAVGALPPRRGRAARTSGASSTTPGAGRPRAVDVADKRVAVVGTASSGVQVVAAIVEAVAELTVYQRSANWCTPLNNRPIEPDEQARLRAGFEELRQVLDTSISGFAHPVNHQLGAQASAEERRAFFELMWASPGFMKLTSNYADLLIDPAVNDEWCAFIAEQDPGPGRRPGHCRAAHPHRPPVRPEAPAVRDRLLRGLQRPQGDAGRPAGDADRAADRDGDRDHRHRAGPRRHRVGHRLRLRHRGPAPHGHRGPRRPGPDRALGRRPHHLPGAADARVPQPVLPGRAPRRGRQQPPLQRRPGRLRDRRARPRPRPRGRRWSRSAPSPRSAGPAWSTRGPG